MALEISNRRYDVVVAGAGPAGSMTAYRLAAAGVCVLVLDAKRFPREKACGGGVQQRASARIPFDWQQVVRGTLCDVSLSFNLRDRFTRKYPQPLVHSVLRAEFDQHLLQAAAKAGATILEGVRVLSLAPAGNDSVCVETDCGPFSGRLLVGADGANSVIGRTLNRRQNYFWQAGLYCEVPEKLLNPSMIDCSTMRIDWGTLPSGYAWIFPKKDYANIGVGCPATIGRFLRPYLVEFLRRECLLRPDALDQLKFAGHQLPTMTRRTRLAGKSVLLVGDAAGLVEPLTGDGISYACHSAEIAAQVILDNLGKRPPDLTPYERLVKDEIGIELLWSRKLLSFAVTFPRLVYRLLRYNDEVWETFCRVLRGEDTFKSLTEAILGRFQFLRVPIEFLVSQCERRRLSRGNPASVPFPAGLDSSLIVTDAEVA